MIQHFSLRCASQPWRNTSLCATFQQACDQALRISEQAFDEDVERWGASRPHPVDVMNHESWTVAKTITFA